MIVLALANGAGVNFKESANGGFCASLDGRDFVLTLQRESLVTPMFGHLEPRQHPEKDHRSLKEPEWSSLLEDGTTFDKIDSWITWALQDRDLHPKLLGVESDEKLRLHVIEFPLQQKLADKLRRIIPDYHEF